MSDGERRGEVEQGAEEQGAGEDNAGRGEAPAESAAAPKERLDEDGLPLDRAPTLDDVRGGAGSGRTIALGCTAIVVAVVLAFWILRGGLLG